MQVASPLGWPAGTLSVFVSAKICSATATVVVGELVSRPGGLRRVVAELQLKQSLALSQPGLQQIGSPRGR